MDIDRKRAADNLGFTSKEQERSLREMDDGVFHAFGPAFKHHGIMQMKVGGVETTHPDRTKGILVKPTKTPDNIKKVLKDVIDLPKEAEGELKSKQDFQKRINELKREVIVLQSSKLKPEIDEKAIERAKQQGSIESDRKHANQLKAIESNCKQLERKLIDIGKVLDKEIVFHKIEQITQRCVPEQRTNSFKPKTVVKQEESIVNHTDEEFDLGPCPKKIYSFLYNHSEREFSRSHVGAFTGYSVKSGGFKNAISKLFSRGLISKHGNFLKVAAMDPNIAGDFDFSKEAIMNNLGPCPKKIYQLLLDNPYENMSREDVADQTGYSIISGGFKNAISKLNSLGLILKEDLYIKLNPELLET